MNIETMKRYILPMVTGGCLLSLLSAAQKIMMHYPLYLYSFLLPFTAGAFAGFLYTMRWIQEKKYHKQIEMHNTRLNTIFETVQSGIMIIDAETFVITSINPAVKDILGYTEKQIVGKNCYDFIRCQSNNCIKDQKVVVENVQEAMIKTTDKDIPIIRKAKIIDIDDHPCILLSIMDISTIVASEKLIHEANERVRTADRLKTEFLMNVGHEIRTPLNAVIGISDLLMESNLSNELREDIELIRYSGHSLLKTMENIIDYAMIKSGNLKIYSYPFNFYESIAFASAVYQDRAKDKGISFKMNIDHCYGKEIIGDKSAFEKIINNLLDNAIKFTESGGITIECQLSFLDSPHIELRITDTGIGIPSEQWEYIFDSFYQIDGSMKRHYEGIGMGLAIVDFYVQQMGGTIEIESTVGKGTSFHVMLPMTLRDIIPER
ncbi:MAG: PAS domain S-box protein [Candidatus Magnetomorum sp.]|nr:PAS domain S-box protein [Candidatus Magnetomorum sp.]